MKFFIFFPIIISLSHAIASDLTLIENDPVLVSQLFLNRNVTAANFLSRARENAGSRFASATPSALRCKVEGSSRRNNTYSGYCFLDLSNPSINRKAVILVLFETKNPSYDLWEVVRIR